MTPDAVVELLVRERPSFHLGGAVWNALPETLALIADHVQPGDRTVETGAGASTVVFAATGARHTAISPIGDEHERIGRGAGSTEWRTATSPSWWAPRTGVLPAMAEREAFDAGFIDGKHSFPHPVVDWHYITTALRTGGVLVLDDLPIPAVTPSSATCRPTPRGSCWSWRTTAPGVPEAGRARAGRRLEAQPYNRGYPTTASCR